jgi:hypothetical protein
MQQQVEQNKAKNQPHFFPIRQSIMMHQAFFDDK